MLRACHRVLKPGGRMAFFTYFDRGKDAGEHRRMLDKAGFVDIAEFDVTKGFGLTAKAWYDWRQRYAAALSNSEGETAFRQKQSIYSGHVQSVRAGARWRYMFVARRR